jgi:hypothetical protein
MISNSWYVPARTLKKLLSLHFRDKSIYSCGTTQIGINRPLIPRTYHARFLDNGRSSRQTLLGLAFRFDLISPFNTPHFTALPPSAALFENDMHAYYS